MNWPGRLNASLVSIVLWLLSGCSTSTADLNEQQIYQAAQAGDGAAQYQLARQLAAKNLWPQAMYWIKKTTDHNNPHPASQQQRASAARQAGDWYHSGLGEARNQSLAVNWWQKAAALGDTDASYQLAQHCRDQNQGKLVAECIHWYTAAARQQNPQAQLAMAEWYAQHQQYTDSIGWLEQAVALHDPQAQYLLAQHYEQGRKLAKNQARAEELYAQSARQGYRPAISRLAALSQGTQARHWYQQAAQAGDASAQLWLGLAWLRGNNGLPRNQDTARYWLKKATDNGSAQATYEYSRLQTDNHLQQLYLQQAAERGYPLALRQLAAENTEREDYPAARRQWQQLADKGDSLAQYQLAEFLRQGLGGSQNLATALKYYRLSALAGSHQAQYRLGILYQQGMGTARNRTWAYAWYALAAVTAEPEALQALNELEQLLTAQEIRKGQQLALKWQQQIQAKLSKPYLPDTDTSNTGLPEEPPASTDMLPDH